jgi:hypothetical protein
MSSVKCPGLCRARARIARWPTLHRIVELRADALFF